MKDDPYAKISGLDQALFKDQPPQQRDNMTTRPRDNDTTLARDNARVSGGAHATTGAGDNEATGVPRSAPPRPRPTVTAKPRSLEATRTRVSAPTGHRAEHRTLERHSHDIYLDQIRWMNRLKLEVEETYGVKLTSNAMVALAVDRFREDYEGNGDDSALMRVLVRGEARGPEDGG